MSALQRSVSVMPTAPGLSPVFNPSALKNGELDQLENWVNGDNVSVYVQWVPDELNEKDAVSFFSTYGKVDRVEFVPKMDANRKQIGRMMFVHFESWAVTLTSCSFAASVASAHPAPHSVPIEVRGKYKAKEYELKCRVNCRPVAKVDYNTHQLTDMFERLNDRVTADLTAIRRDNALQSEDLFQRFNSRIDTELLALRKENSMLFEMIDSLLRKENARSALGEKNV